MVCVCAAQSEYGDIYKCTLEYKTAGDVEMVTELKLKYFDTLPTCAALCVLKTGFLFAGSEFGNHALYQFQGIGDHADDVESSSSTSSLPSLPSPFSRTLHACLSLLGALRLTRLSSKGVSPRVLVVWYHCGTRAPSPAWPPGHALRPTHNNLSRLPPDARTPDRVWFWKCAALMQAR